MTRKLATIRKISELRPIEAADAIEVAVIGGWQVVVKKGEFQVNDPCVYFEIDSFLPDGNPAWQFLVDKQPRTFEGVVGHRLRTVKLRGQISQGFVVPLSKLDAVRDDVLQNGYEGRDFSELLGVVKWEAPIPAQLAGDVEGPFPTVIPKTDQERIQNLTEELKEWQGNSDFTWEATEKLDGSSMTVFVNGDQQGVCSRNWSLKETEGNSLWKVARREQLIEKIRRSGRNLALQGEIIGEGIQGNRYNVVGQDFRLFDIYDIDRGEYLTPLERQAFARMHNITHVPVIAHGMVIEEFAQGLLTMAEGKSVLNGKAEREGLVFKSNTCGGPSFKAISNKFLIKGGD